MPRYLSTDVPKVLRKYTIAADEDKDVPDPNYGTDPVPHSIRQYLPYAPKWTTWPDYQRVCLHLHSWHTGPPSQAGRQRLPPFVIMWGCGSPMQHLAHGPHLQGRWPGRCMLRQCCPPRASGQAEQPAQLLPAQ